MVCQKKQLQDSKAGWAVKTLQTMMLGKKK
jgi:hypothetical protein